MNSENRHGRFTSSNIHKLFGSKRVRETYIQEKQIEKRMGAVLSTGGQSQSMRWGHFMEMIVLIETQKVTP